ncbi:MAG TPA: LysR family transcriptional regulator [Candidatus Bathyarchaeia archaeon]|nr:LysR family transcriptional regulator [Candidatus Bathyarchaeia archaeon]
MFLESARAGSVRGAAQRSGQSVNVLHRKLQRLEQTLGTALLTRHTNGVRLTEEGRRVFAIAERMEANVFEMVRETTGSAVQSGQVSLAATEALGGFWIAPRLRDFRHRHPNIGLKLLCTMPPANILKLEADLSVQLARPSDSDVKVVKLCRIHFMPFASRDYVARRGSPRNFAEMANHDYVFQAAPQSRRIDETPAPLAAILGQKNPALETNGSIAFYSSIAGGLGIGMLPTYVQTAREPLVPIEVGYRVHNDIWLVYHSDAGRIPRVRSVMDWVMAVFSPQTYPWFGDQFMHPNDVRAAATSMPDSIFGARLF